MRRKFDAAACIMSKLVKVPKIMKDNKVEI